VVPEPGSDCGCASGECRCDIERTERPEFVDNTDVEEGDRAPEPEPSTPKVGRADDNDGGSAGSSDLAVASGTAEALSILPFDPGLDPAPAPRGRSGEDACGVWAAAAAAVLGDTELSGIRRNFDALRGVSAGVGVPEEVPGVLAMFA
jgi:hypothetical protein